MNLVNVDLARGYFFSNLNQSIRTNVKQLADYCARSIECPDQSLKKYKKDFILLELHKFNSYKKHAMWKSVFKKKELKK